MDKYTSVSIGCVDDGDMVKVNRKYGIVVDRIRCNHPTPLVRFRNGEIKPVHYTKIELGYK